MLNCKTKNDDLIRILTLISLYKFSMWVIFCTIKIHAQIELRPSR